MPKSNDTTSHNFSINRIDTLGSIFSKVNGIDIFSESNIWVTGKFSQMDTMGKLTYPYNLAHWNGIAWTYLSVPMKGWNESGPSISELGAVKIFSDSNVIVIAQNDNSVGWWDGSDWYSSYVNEAFISPTIWSRSPSEIYFVGSKGRVAYFDGIVFKNINTKITNPTLADVWGDDNYIYTVGYENSENNSSETLFLSIHGLISQINNLYDYKIRSTDPPYPYQNIGPMFSVYRANTFSKLWVLGGKSTWPQLFEIQSLSPFQAKLFFDIPSNYGAFTIRGTSDNDLYLVSQFNNTFYHFNGSTWFKYTPSIFDYTLSFSKSSFVVKNQVWTSAGYFNEGVAERVGVIIGKHYE